MTKDNNVSTHISLHNSGATNIDHLGNSGTHHEHHFKDGTVIERWEVDGRTYQKDDDGNWRDSDGKTPAQR